jgi:hypothetical protein
MDERLIKVTTVTVVTTVDTTSKHYKILLFNVLNYWLQPLRPFSYLLLILIIHSDFNRFLQSSFISCVELENYRHGRNLLFNTLIFIDLQLKEVVTEVVTVVTKSRNYLQINKLRL